MVFIRMACACHIIVFLRNHHVFFTAFMDMKAPYSCGHTVVDCKVEGIF